MIRKEIFGGRHYLQYLDKGFDKSIDALKVTSRAARVVPRISTFVGLSAIEGSVYPLAYFWELTKNPQGKLEKALTFTPLVPPTLAALLAGVISHDGGTALVIGGGAYWLEGTLFAGIGRLISPAKENLIRLNSDT